MGRTTKRRKKWTRQRGRRGGQQHRKEGQRQSTFPSRRPPLLLQLDPPSQGLSGTGPSKREEPSPGESPNPSIFYERAVNTHRNSHRHETTWFSLPPSIPLPTPSYLSSLSLFPLPPPPSPSPLDPAPSPPPSWPNDRAHGDRRGPDATKTLTHQDQYAIT